MDGLPRNLVDAIRKAADGSLMFIFGKESMIWKDGKFVAAPVSALDLPPENILYRSPGRAIWFRNGTHLLKYNNDQLMHDVDLGFTARRAVDDS